jgi:hypothetical protein
VRLSLCGSRARRRSGNAEAMVCHARGVPAARPRLRLVALAKAGGTMRDPDRIDAIIERLRAVWKRHPDLRLGQMVSNGAEFWPGVPVHIIEDEPLIEAVEQVHL